MINIKTKEEIEIMAEGGKILAQILEKLSEAVRPGVATLDLDKLARELCLSYGVKPAFLGYNDFPAALCVSVNDEVVHGLPSERILKENDIASLDMGITHKGFVTDSAVTVPVIKEGEGYGIWVQKNTINARLIETAKSALKAGIEKAIIGNRIGAISYAVQKTVEKNGFGVVMDLVGHGVGRQLHEDPQVPNFGHSNDGPELAEGMVIAIEPMITTGDSKVKLAPDGITFLTQDGLWSAHFEHTVAITKEGPKILTL